MGREVVALPCRVPNHDYPHIPPDEYDACVVDQATGLYFFGRPRCVVWWSIITPGHMGVIVPSYYRVPALAGKPRPRGRYYRVGMRSNLVRDLAVMLNERPPLDHYPLNRVTNHIYRVAVRTVIQDREQHSIPEPIRYSVVDRVLGRLQ